MADHAIGPHLTVDGETATCAECGETLGSITENLKAGLLVEEAPIEDAGPHYVDPERFVSEEMVFRRYYCPGCATQLFTESCKPSDEPVSEMELDPETL